MSKVIDEQLKSMIAARGFKPFYKLRYRLDFAGRKTKVGKWNRADTDIKDQVWSQKKDGLVRVAIEAEKQQAWTIETMFECDGHEYASMRWVMVASIGGWYQGKVRKQGTVVGLTVLTATHATTVFIDGTKSVKALSEYEKAFPHIKEHSV